VFDNLTGNITNISEKAITLLVNGTMGFHIQTPKPHDLDQEKEITISTYVHWNSDNGPSLYGFPSVLDKKVFMLIIQCPKIGPSIALSALSQLSSSQFVELVSKGDEKLLSKINGIGPKKASQIIATLKDKIQKLLTSGELEIEQQQSFAAWQQLSEVLSSLNYTKPEISRATEYLSAKYTDQNYPLDKLIRSALAFLAQKQ